MPLFDSYVMVDWSGGDRRRGAKQDCIWIAHGPATADVPITESAYSRTEAEHVIRTLITGAVETQCRVLVCADFAYGYPAGFASLLQDSASSRPSWRVVW